MLDKAFETGMINIIKIIQTFLNYTFKLSLLGHADGHAYIEYIICVFK